MGLFDVLFGKKTTKPTKATTMIKDNDIHIHDRSITINSIDYFGMYEKSQDGNWLISWRDNSQGRTNGEQGEYLLYDLANKRITTRGKVERPNSGHVANNGTFSIEDWMNSGSLIGTFNVFSSSGESLFKETLQANILNSGISKNGLLAVCQTANNPNGDDGSVMLAVDIQNKSKLFKINPEIGWADDYDFDEDKLLVKVIVKDIGKFSYDRHGNFLDSKNYLEARLNSKLYYVAILACDEIIKEDNISMELANTVFDSATKALANGGAEDKNYKPMAIKVQGLAQLAMGNETEALKCFDEAMHINPKIGLKRKADSLRKKLKMN